MTTKPNPLAIRAQEILHETMACGARIDRENLAIRIARLEQRDAAVAELIERDRAQREALETCERWFAKHSPTAPLINGLGEAEHPMLTMLRAALARFEVQS